MKKLRVIVAILMFIGTSSFSKTLKVGLASGAYTMDPQAFNETSTNSILSNIFDTLVRFDENIKVRPSLAKSWSNPEPTVWIMNLKRDVKFHNGNIFSADDVLFTFNRIKQWDKSGFKGKVSMIDKVEKIDKFTVKFTTKKAFPIFLRKLTYVSMLDKETLEGKSDNWIGLHPMGTGPYRLISWSKGSQIKLKAYQNYWLGEPFFSDLVFKILTNNATRTAAILSGEVDIINRVPVVDVNRIKKNYKLNTFIKPGLRLIYLQMDQFREKSPYAKTPTGKNPFLDIRVRRAIYYGVNEDAIVKFIMKGFALPAAQFHPSTVVGYDPLIKRVRYNPKKAKQLLLDAGYPNGFSVTLDTPNNRYINDSQIAQAVASSLAKIGIKVRVNATPKSTFFPKTAEQKTSFFLIGWASSDGDGSSMLDGVVHSKNDKIGYGRYNNGKYSNKKVDKIIEKSSANMSPELRLKDLREAQRIAIIEDQNIIPLHFQVDIYAISKKINFIPRTDSRIWAFDIKVK